MNQIFRCLLLLFILFFTFSSSNYACSRFTYTGANNIVITGRSMDWVEDLHTDLWAFPAGLKHQGSSEPNSVEWISKYGSVIASAYDMGSTDGINTKGLNANMLYLATSDYGKSNPARKNLSVLNWAQYVLDNYATVDETVKDFSQDKFNMLGHALPNGYAATIHLSITDPTGDNAIFEYVNGKLIVHHNKAYKVMTNEPTYEKQLTLNAYWQNLQGKFLPGTGEPEDRFVRASYYVNTAAVTPDLQQSLATAFSIIRNVSVPMQEGFSNRPNVSATIWRSVADLQNKVYYFESANRPNVFWIDLNKLNLNIGAPVKKLPLQQGQVYAGEVSDKFVASKPFYEKNNTEILNKKTAPAL